jgi:hypothetical protein
VGGATARPGGGSASLLVVLPVGGDVEACTGGRGSARRHYSPPLEPVGGSALSTPVLSV